MSGKRPLSITVRLTVLFAIMSASILLLLGVVIGAAVRQHFEEQDMNLLSGKLELIKHALDETTTPQEWSQLPQRLEDALVGHEGLAVRIVGAGGNVLFVTPADFAPPVVRLDLSQDPIGKPLTWLVSGDPHMRGISAFVSPRTGKTASVEIAVGTDISHHQHFMDSFRATLWTFLPLAAVAIGLLGWIAVRHGLSPLKAIQCDAANITANRLNARVTMDAIPIELVGVAEAL